MKLKNRFYRYIYRLYNNLSCNEKYQNHPSVRYFKNFWIHIIQKDFFELKNRYYNANIEYNEEQLYLQMKYLFKNKIVIPFIDLSVTTKCTLNCRDCSQWIPYIKGKELFSSKKIITDLENLFNYVDYIHMISPLGGEPFLNAELDSILAYLIKKSNEGKIGYIRLVTNGTIFPNKKTLTHFNHPNVSILISDYGMVFNEDQQQNREQLINYFKINNLRYYVAWTNNINGGGGGITSWTDMGKPKKHTKTELELANTFKTCPFANCVGLYNGGLYRCGRAYTLKKIHNYTDYETNETIKIDEISSKRMMKRYLKKFYSLNYLQACRYCLSPHNRKLVAPAIQIHKQEI